MSCVLNFGRHMFYRSYILILVTYLSDPPTPIEKFHCLVDNWLSMKCWFDLGVVYKRWNVPGYMTVNITMIEVKAGIM